MKKNKICDIVFWVIVILILINTGFAYLTYKQVSDKKEPTFIFNKKITENKITYSEVLYKVTVEEDNKTRVVSLKLFFLK